jgi:uroporphyrinogen-III decarboxylase
VTDQESWEAHKAHTLSQLALHCTPENMERTYGKYREGCAKGEYAMRLRLQGFFWCPRDLMGVEQHLISYYDQPELLKQITRFQLDVYKEHLNGILKIIKPSTLFFEEDFSGKTGPMISVDCFNEFVTPYYREIIPFLKERGVGEIFLDTDGDFTLMIPHMLACGLDGVLPVDVNAGVDIVKVRAEYPELKFWGGFNKLCIIEGPEAIDAEFKRLEPVIRQGGCMICTDHQVSPHTPLAHYRYYLTRLREEMARLRGERAE